MNCETIDPLVTPFVDGQCTPAQEATVANHLRACAACRARVEAESAARILLHTQAADARAMGVEPAWRPRVWRLGRPALPVRPVTAMAILLASAATVGFWLQPAQASAIGVIGDSACAETHRFTTRFGVSEEQCTLGCVARGAEFVLITDSGILRIRNQEFPTLAEFADQRVEILGRASGDGITVSRMEAIP